MNEKDLSRLLRRAASTMPAGAHESLEPSIMARVKTDEGRAKRWRSFVQWLLLLAAISGTITASMVCWSMASRDNSHTRPPTMNLFREGLPR